MTEIIYEIFTDLRIFVPLVFALQLIFLKSRYSRSSKILALYLLVLSLYWFLNKAMIYKTLFFGILNAVLLLPISLVFHPLIYLYIKSLTTINFKFENQQIVHFILPFFSFFTFLITTTYALITSNLLIIKNVFILAFPIIITSYYIQFIVYTILMIIELKKHKRNILEYFSFTEAISLNWLWGFIIIYILFTIYDAYNAYSYLIHKNEEVDNLYKIFITIYILFLSFYGLRQAEIYKFKEDETLPETPLPDFLKKIELEKKDNQVTEETKKYSYSPLTEEEKQKMADLIIKKVVEEKLYRHHKLSLEDIENATGIKKRLLSQILNEVIGKNFYHFINDFRIEEAKVILEKDIGNLKIDAVGESVGFHSRTSFINAFKAKTGLTPSQYHEKYGKKPQSN